MLLRFSLTTFWTWAEHLQEQKLIDFCLRTVQWEGTISATKHMFLTFWPPPCYLLEWDIWKPYAPESLRYFCSQKFKHTNCLARSHKYVLSVLPLMPWHRKWHTSCQMCKLLAVILRMRRCSVPFWKWKRILRIYELRIPFPFLNLLVKSFLLLWFKLARIRYVTPVM